MGTNTGTENGQAHAITLAGGCFWEIEAGFRGLPGILATVVGYTGGDEENPDYVRVSTGETGHVEAVCIAYDPVVITLPEIFSRFFGLFDPVVQIPQAGSPGSQYNSGIFCHTEEDCCIAQAFVHDEEMSGKYEGSIVTTVQPLNAFWPAEECHQQYYEKIGNRYRTPLF